MLLDDNARMTHFAHWYLLIGVLLLLLVFTSATIRRAPISTAMLYLGIGWGLGRLGLLTLDPARHGPSLEVLTEIAVVTSLFTAGLKLRKPLGSRLWRLPLALASLSMVLTVSLVAILGVFLLDLPLGAGILLGAILAPTDPVLASDVQVSHAGDTNRLRFTLTGEAGLNDGTAFPFVLLGLGLLGLHELGAGAWRWLAVDVLWAIGAGLAIGALLGKAVGQLVVFLRRRYLAAVGYDDFLALGLIATSYGLALALHAYGFLAVFAAGMALRTVERDLSGDEILSDISEVRGTDAQISSHEQHAPAFMAAAVLNFNEQMERLGELALMLVTGALLAWIDLSAPAVALALLLFFIVRPLAVAPVSLAAGMSVRQAAMVSWFGIRGIGSLYYLFYAINLGIPSYLAGWMVETVVCVIATSVILHGLSVDLLMRRYSQDRGMRK